MRTALITLSIGIWLIAGLANAKLDPAGRCEIDKLKQAKRYHSCRMKAEGKAIRTFSDPSEAIANCDLKYGIRWQRIEAKGGGACPTNGDQASMQLRLTGQTDDVTTLLSGGTLPSPTPGTCPATGQVTCWEPTGTVDPGPVIPCAGTGQDGEIRAGAALAYVDNDDGTITDQNTGLMWEKLSDDGSIHDWNDRYTWDEAFSFKVATLNGGGGFAGHTDWRVPNSKELYSIVNLEVFEPSVSPAFHTGCTPACTVATCSCTSSVTFKYWSSSSVAQFPASAWSVDFSNGFVTFSGKIFFNRVRAVRGP